VRLIHIISPSYPPEPGGLSEHTYLLAKALAEGGDEVRVWAPAYGGRTPPEARGVRVTLVPRGWGPGALRAMSKGMAADQPDAVIVQFLVNGYGWLWMNLPFCYWLRAQARKHPLWVLFHQMVIPRRRGNRLRRTVREAVGRYMDLAIASAAQRLLVTIPEWAYLLTVQLGTPLKIDLARLFSNVPVVRDDAGIAAIRKRYVRPGGTLIGNFCAGMPLVDTVSRGLYPTLLKHREAVLLLIGGINDRAAAAIRSRLVSSDPALAERIHITGYLTLSELSLHLSACDLFVQPVHDCRCGTSSKLASVLAHGRPSITTVSAVTEDFWAKSNALLAADAGDPRALQEMTEFLTTDREARHRYAAAARELYLKHLDIRHVVRTLGGGNAAAEGGVGSGETAPTGEVGRAQPARLGAGIGR